MRRLMYQAVKIYGYARLFIVSAIGVTAAQPRAFGFVYFFFSYFADRFDSIPSKKLLTPEANISDNRWPISLCSRSEIRLGLI
jgi:hypothetical protein